MRVTICFVTPPPNCATSRVRVTSDGECVGVLTLAELPGVLAGLPHFRRQEDVALAGSPTPRVHEEFTGP